MRSRLPSRGRAVLPSGPKEPLAEREAMERHQDVFCVVAGVPCQDWSIAGKREGIKGKRSGLVYQFARILQELRPHWFVFENVPGLLSANDGRDFAEVLRLLMVECGYGIQWRVLNSQFSESPKDAVACSLSDVLEESVPPRFFLTPRAATGILRRAEKRKRILPYRLQQALQSLSRVGDSATTLISPTESEATNGTHRKDRQTLSLKPCPQNGQKELPGLQETNITTSSPCQSPGIADGAERTETLTSLEHSGARAADSEQLTSTDTAPTSVRRLTPTECEILQGFPKGWTVPDTEHWATRSRSKSRNGSHGESSH